MKVQASLAHEILGRERSRRRIALHTTKISLGQEPDFTLGGVQVSPSRGLVSDGATEHRVTPQVMQALLVLLRAEGRTVTRDELIEACWDGRVVSDDATSRVIALVRGIARPFDPPPFQLRTIPKIGFRLDSAEPQGAEPAEPAPVDSSSTPSKKHPRSGLAPLLFTLFAVVAVGLAWAGWRTLHTGARTSSMARVEVAPFQSLRAGDPDVARLSPATRDALLRVLRGADIPVVEAPTPGADPAPDADFQVHGAVDRDGEAMVINAQLLDRRGRNVLWSGRIERPLSAPARFPDQAANRIGDMLHCALRSRATSNRRMTDAVLSLMLQACDLRRVAPDDLPKFLAAAERLRAAAPELSGAQSLYAMAAAGQAVETPDGPNSPQAAALITAARGAARRALQLDPKNGEAYFAMGISYGFDGAWEERDNNFSRAEALSDGLSYFADLHVGVLREIGRVREALALNRRTVADDPFSSGQLSTLIILTAAAEGPEAAEPLLQSLRLLAPPEHADIARMTATFWWDDPKAAAAMLARTADGFDTAGRACFRDYLTWLQRPQPHRGLPDRCRKIQTDWRVRMLAREGDVDGAYREIGQAHRGSQSLVALYYPEMRAFRADPRFMPLAARLGLVDYWTRSGHWPDFCADRDRPYNCAAVARELGSSYRTVPHGPSPKKTINEQSAER